MMKVKTTVAQQMQVFFNVTKLLNNVKLSYVDVVYVCNNIKSLAFYFLYKLVWETTGTVSKKKKKSKLLKLQHTSVTTIMQHNSNKSRFMNVTSIK